MVTTKKVIGLDISKKTIDACLLVDSQVQHIQVSNNHKGFKKLMRLGDTHTVYVMEATGPYYLQVASYLYDNNREVSVINPLVIRRYSQMLFQRAKTDKADANTIAKYAQHNEVKLWVKPSEANLQLKQLHTAIELLSKQITMLQNQIEAFNATGVNNPLLVKELKQQLKTNEQRKLKLEKAYTDLVNITYPESYKRLQKIPSIGPKTAAILCVITEGFTKFSNYKQLIAYIGFSPRIYQSGTSVNGRGRICKLGQSQVRKLLYMCSWTAKTCNKSCMEMYERLKEKGKPERVIKVAIANKLLKQAFAIGKYGREYDENFVAKTCF